MPLSYIVDIRPSFTTTIPDNMPLNAAETGHREGEIDFLARINDPTFRAFVGEVENDLNTDYNPVDDYDEDEFTEVKSMHVVQLDAMSAHDMGQYTFDLTGLVYHEAIEHDGTLNAFDWQSHEDAVLIGFDIKQMDSRWRVVLAVEVLTGESEETIDGVEELVDLVYIVPNPDSLASLVRYRASVDVWLDESDQDLRQNLHDTSDLCNHLVQSDAFARLSLQEQTRSLHMTYRHAKEQVEQLFARTRDGENSVKVYCETTRYWAMDWEEGARTSSAITLTPGFIGDYRDPFFLSGEDVALDIPELDEPRSQNFHGAASFPLSNGMPMVIIEDGANMMTYYVPVSEIKLLAPSNERST